MRTSPNAPVLALGSLTLGALALLSSLAYAQPVPPPEPPPVPEDSAAPQLPAPTTSVAPTPPDAPPASTQPSAAPQQGATPQQPVTTPAFQAPIEAPVIPAPEPKPEDTAPGRDKTWDFWQIAMGARVSWIPNKGFDPFSENNAMGSFSLSGTRTLLRRGNAALAVGVIFEPGGKDAEARGQDSSLAVTRYGGIIEGRYHLAAPLYVLIKTVPQAVYTGATIEDSSAPEDLEQTKWRFGLDATAGAAFDFVHGLGANRKAVGMWVLGEFGYGWTTANDLVLKPDIDDEDDPRSNLTLDLGSLALRGPLMRVSLAITF